MFTASSSYIICLLFKQGCAVMITCLPKAGTRCIVSCGHVAIRTTTTVQRALGAIVLFLIGLFALSVIFICEWHSLSANQMSHGCVCHYTTSELLSATLYSGSQDISVKWCFVQVLHSLLKVKKSRFKGKSTSYLTILLNSGIKSLAHYISTFFNFRKLLIVVK